MLASHEAIAPGIPVIVTVAILVCIRTVLCSSNWPTVAVIVVASVDRKAARTGRASSIVVALLGVFRMSKSKPKSTGPMTMQPLERGSMMSTQGLPVMPTVGKAAKTPQPKQQPTRAEVARAAEATITRQNSLRKQRDAQKS